MTRDEAIRIVSNSGGSGSWPSSAVDALVALGVLSLKEPEDIQYEFLSDMADRAGAVAAMIMTDTLAQRGLKIVKK